MTSIPPKPPLEGLRRQMHKAASGVKPNISDGYIRETFSLPRSIARVKAREWFETYPKAAYWTEIESWYVRPNDVIEFTIRRLPSSD
ncbi:hypothetical protein KHQ08_12320 [Pseudochrobactrum algeriensis]|uniref:hypothetical protein n=1 Tax=Pseudochrobactrum algeriensis TaxID=2834768 RepID=UPI001BCB5654|nr:hypothetical protein [Pseudochrobactrum algeriensis]MBX8811573.1 hypothetical protein [Ochrobactrum sp. MR34]QVQ35971.1 hypothetical protein KHQ08_12320 [Pseudochrobactrum algeriensis]QVQ39189.1 hypothetical protein KHQ07_10610 [Pseudochrobactrum algeriensis]QVQ43109.1 hypothetical protein KHQ09_12570 [Pseudochrobactrum algeriensis]